MPILRLILTIPYLIVMSDFDLWRQDMLAKTSRIHMLESNLLTWAVLNGRELKDWETSDELS